ncbi:MAG: MGDG synthase family glycosyltransferase [Blautia sp.]
MDALILTCSTGGGHNAAAYAVKEELIRRGERVTLLNPYGLYSKKLEKGIDRSYVSLVKNLPHCFGWLYKLGEFYRKLPFPSPIYWLNGKMVRVMENYLRQNHFDVIIMTHIFPGQIMAHMKARGIKLPKTILIATDYVCIPFSEETDCDAYIIPSHSLMSEFKNKGIPEKRIYPLGIPVRSAFTCQGSKRISRKRLGINNFVKFILISGGSIGAGKLERVVKLLYERCSTDIEIAVICGDNKRLYDRLSKKYGNAIRVIQNTDRIADYMRSSDIYLTKPGGLSSTEAAVMGIPLVHLPAIPGCETKNAEFFYQNGMSLRVKGTKIDMLQVLNFMENSSKCNEMREQQRKGIPYHATSKICELIIDMARSV